VHQQDTNPPYEGIECSRNHVQHHRPLFQWMAHIFAYNQSINQSRIFKVA